MFAMTSGSSSKVTRSSLLFRARQRDSVAWRELVDLYGPLIVAWCKRCGLDAHTSADCLQDVLTAVAVGMDSFEPTGSSGAFRAWLWTITRRKVIDCLRRSKRAPTALGGSTAAAMFKEMQDVFTVPEDEPSDEFHVRDLIDRALLQVRSEFEEATWKAFWRSVVDGLPTDLVAAELATSPAAIRQARSRILRRLRQQLGDL
ncbi:MAG: sigma-70 family RNA polymerase sigma factor [Planctomycetaceae bacterium]|nr:sigma-70 family RNA polymerase sigma factor [Planctomycetaceae bacterium]